MFDKKRKNCEKPKIDDGKITNDLDGAFVFSSKKNYIDTVRAVIEAVEKFKTDNTKYELFNFGVLKFHKNPQNNRVVYFHIENKGKRQKYWNAAYEEKGKYIAECTLKINKKTIDSTYKEIKNFNSLEIKKAVKEAIKETIEKNIIKRNKYIRHAF